MPKLPDHLALLERVLPSGSINDLRFSLNCIGIAEELLGAWEKQRPAGRSSGVLLLLRPTPPLYHRAEELYRSHCAEILERVSAGRPCEPFTKAEILSLALDITLKGPPVRGFMHMIDRLWVDCIGPLPGEGCQPAEFPGQYEEMLADMHRRYAENWRNLPKAYEKSNRRPSNPVAPI